MMSKLTTTEAMSRAVERARASNLLVRRATLPRQYRVTNRDNANTYTVNFFVRSSDRAKFAHCTCPSTTVCKHIAAACALNWADAVARREAARIERLPEAA